MQCSFRVQLHLFCEKIKIYLQTDLWLVFKAGIKFLFSGLQKVHCWCLINTFKGHFYLPNQNEFEFAETADIISKPSRAA